MHGTNENETEQNTTESNKKSNFTDWEKIHL